MKKVKDFKSINRLHIEEDYGFHVLVKNLIAYILDPAIEPKSAEYNKALNLFDLALKEPQASQYTEKVQIADQKFDELLRSLRQIVKQMLKFPIAAKQEAAKEMFAILEKYGDITILNYEEQSGAYENMQQDFDALGEEKQTLLGVKEIIDELEVQKTQFDAFRIERAKEQGAKEKGYIAQCRKDADEAYSALIELVNALALINGPEAYLEFINAINAIIDEQTARLSARKTRNEAKRNATDAPNAPVDTAE